MTPPIWSSRDEELWMRYMVVALAAVAARGSVSPHNVAVYAARIADAAMRRHRKRFPLPPEEPYR